MAKPIPWQCFFGISVDLTTIPPNVAVTMLIGGIVIGLLMAGLRRSAKRGRHADSARLFRQMAEASGEGMFEFDLLSRRTLWCKDGRGEVENLGWLHRFQIGTDYDRVYPDDREALRNGWDGLARGEKMELLVRLREPGEAWCWCHLSVVPVADRRGRFTRAVGLLRNTNDLHQTQESLAEERRLKSVGTIAGGIAHEFNNHLTPVRGYLELAIDELGLDHPCTEGLQTALDRVVHCSDLVSQIQAYGRKSLLVLRPTNLADYLPEVLRLGAGMDAGTARDVTVEAVYAEELPEVMLDRAQFQQGMGHLIRNAFEAMPSGGELHVKAYRVDVDEGACIGKREATPGAFLCVEITDSGVGIPREHLDQVLDPFFTTHGRARARGMGLPMVQGMMAQHGGWMEIRSEEGAGTSIRLYFPITKPAVPEPPQGECGTPRTAEPAGLVLGRMLIGDDEGFIRDIVRTVFRNQGWAVDEAASFYEVADCLEQRVREPYELLILDLTMRGPTAEDIVQWLAVNHPATKVLITSGVTRAARIDQLEAQAHVTFIPKPFSTKDLVRTVDSMMAEKPVLAQ